jgi:hypothetical protein
MREALQERLKVAGVKVILFDLTDLAYAKEIAGQMLVRQQAEAMIDARKKIVQGAVDIAGDSVSKLAEKGVMMSQEEVSRLSANLIIAICGDKKITPTMNL